MICYVADISQDIDDTIAIEYLYGNNVLDCFVLDNESDMNNKNVIKLLKMDIRCYLSIPSHVKNIICGGSLKPVYNFLQAGHIVDCLVMNGGFAGSNIVKPCDELSKFKNKEKIRTYNFNRCPDIVIDSLYHKNIKEVYLVSKNVCHNEINTFGKLHNDEFLKPYNLSKKKKLHDLLAAKEGNYIINGYGALVCKYTPIDITSDKIDGIHTKWGSKISNDLKIVISVDYI